MNRDINYETRFTANFNYLVCYNETQAHLQILIFKLLHTH